MTTTQYCQRPLTQADWARVQQTIAAAKIILKHSTYRLVRLELQNTVNPNGFHVLVTRGETKVQRFVNVMWARRRGFTDVQPRTRQKSRASARLMEDTPDIGR